jgi:hypothetical protein
VLYLGGSPVVIPLDARLRDDQALDEIELTSNLIIAASACDERLTQLEVDEILGLPAGS